MKIGFLSYYGPLNFELESDGTRENGNRRFIELGKELKQSKIEYENYNSLFHSNYDVIIVNDIPNLLNLFNLKFKNLYYRVPLILLIEETQIARNRILLLVKGIFDEVLVNTEEEIYKFKNYRTSNFSLASIPSKGEILKNKSFILNSNRHNKIVYIGRNKTALSKNSSYSFRTKIIIKLSKYKRFFTLYGDNWDKRQIPMDIPFIFLIKKFKILSNLIIYIINIKKFLVFCKGSVPSKLITQNKYDFTLAIEPYMGHPISILEKIFDPMLSGSIPIYYGPELKFIPSNCYIRINRNTTEKDILLILENLKFEDKEKYRKNIYNFLISDKANKYRYSTFAKFLVNKIKKRGNH